MHRCLALVVVLCLAAVLGAPSVVAAPTGSSLALGNDPGKPQIAVATSPTQSPSLQLSDREGNAVWKAP